MTIKLFAALGALSLACSAQTPAVGPTFDVATIKTAEPIEKAFSSGKLPRIGPLIDGARAEFNGMPLPTLLTVAYKLKPFQISGPSWFPGERFDIQASIPDGVSKEQVPEMLQALLVERFKVASHRETKDHPVYVLSVAKGGPKLKDASAAAPEPPEPAPSKPVFLPGFGPGGPGGDVSIERKGNGVAIRSAQTGPIKITPGPNGTMHMEFAKATLQQMVDVLTPFLDKPVVNETDLKGEYQFALDLRMLDLMAAARSAGVAVGAGGGLPPGVGPGGAGWAGLGGGGDASDPGGSSVFQAIQQLGLKLEPRKAPMEMLVIDHIEKLPTEN